LFGALIGLVLYLRPTPAAVPPGPPTGPA
jgi:hypothetical protein